MEKTDLSHSDIEQTMMELINIIPKEIPPEHKKSDSDFTRKRSLPTDKTIILTLSITGSRKDEGADIQIGNFFRLAERSGMNDASQVHKSSVTKARKKVPYQLFADMPQKTADFAYKVWEKDGQYLRHGMSVFALDGSKYILPAVDELREFYDPKSGLRNSGKGHFPQCLVSTVYDVFRRLPIVRTVVPNDSSERTELIKLLPAMPNGIRMSDRGYPSYETINCLSKNYEGFFIFGCPAGSTFPAVETFVRSNKQESVIWITPSDTFKRKVTFFERGGLRPIRVRIIRLASPDGTVSVLLTNLYGSDKYHRNGIIELYFRRWRVEDYYRDEKVVIKLEKFHSRSQNGILQELYASMAMCVISRILMMLARKHYMKPHQEPQFKNAIITVSLNAVFLMSSDYSNRFRIFIDILELIVRVKYYRPKKCRPSQPRVNKSAINKWKQKRSGKVYVGGNP